VGLDRDDALGLHQLGQLEKQRQQILIVLLLPLGARHHLAQSAGYALEDAHFLPDGQRTHGGAENHQEFHRRGFRQHFETAAFHEEDAKDHRKDGDDADDRKHG
jgi:hypothetical protein